MQLLATQKTEVAISPSSAISAKDSESNSAFDEHFNQSMQDFQSAKDQAATVQHTQQQERRKDLQNVSESLSGAKTNANPNDDTDWNELVSQSDSMKAAITNETKTEHSSATSNPDDSMILKDISELTPVSVDETLFAQLQASQDTEVIDTTQSSFTVAQVSDAELDITSELSTDATLLTDQEKAVLAADKLAADVKAALNVELPADIHQVDAASSKLGANTASASLEASAHVELNQDKLSQDMASADAQQLTLETELISNEGKTSLSQNSITNNMSSSTLGQLSQSTEQNPMLTAGANNSVNIPSDITPEQLTNEAQELLLKLSPKQIEQVAQQLFNRLDQGQKNLGDAQQFVSNLKSGIAEIKAQAQDGHVAGIDLSALVKDSLGTASVAPLKLDQVVQQVNNTLGLFGLQQHSAAMSPQTNDTPVGGVDMIRQQTEVSVAQFEQSKLSNQQPAQSSFDKAVNLFKPDGAQQLAEKVRFMNNNRQISAEMRLDPAELGAMQVKISMNGDNATVNMVVQTSQAREALEQATPRLREMLEEQGLSLGESSVSRDDSAGQQSSFGESQSGQPTTNSIELEENVETGNIIAEQSIHNGSIGGIDYYA